MTPYKKLSALENEALQLICQPSFHRVLHIPATPSQPRLRVTYATTSNFDDDSLPVIYYCGPMFPSRYHAVGFDHLAVATGVRVICIDRPSLGGSTPVPLPSRIPHFLTVLPLILSALQILHISLVSHSAGTIHLLNSLLRHRSLLHPTRPYAALMAPFSSTSASQTALISVVTKLPSSMLGGWNSIVRFLSTTAMPASNWSGGILTAAGEVFQTPKVVGSRSGSGSGSCEGGDDEGEGEVLPGLSKKLQKEIEKLQVKFMMMEETAGLNEELRTCLKKDGVKWGDCEDYSAYVSRLVEVEKGLSVGGKEQAKLKVRAFFAQSDVIVGKTGQKYFGECWRQDGVADHIDYEDVQLPGTDHDSIVVDLKNGALKRIFEEVRENSR